MQRSEVIHLVYIVVLLATIILLMFTVKQYMNCTDTMKYYNTSICEGCKKLTDLGYLKWVGG